MPSPRHRAPATSISVHSSSKHFDAFLKSITKVKTLGEARRLKADVEREMRNIHSSDGGQMTEHDRRRRVKYMQRLERAKDHIDDRVAALTGLENVSQAIGAQWKS